MRILPAVLTWLMCIAFANAKPTDEQIAKAFTERDPIAFKQALAELKKAEVPALVLAEAEFLYAVDQHDDSAIIGMAKRLESLEQSFLPSESFIFEQKEDFSAIVRYARALEALEKGDSAKFKTLITEAFWLSPQQAPIFSPYIEKFRLDQAMKGLKIDLGRTFRDLTSDQSISLAKLIEKSKAPAILLHFWSPWSQESELSLPDFLKAADEITKGGIPVVSVLLSEGAEIEADAREIQKKLQAEQKSFWIIDAKKTLLSSQLRVRSLPVMALLSTDGEVLFNGSPVNQELWEKLKILSPMIDRPISGLIQAK